MTIFGNLLGSNPLGNVGAATSSKRNAILGIDNRPASALPAGFRRTLTAAEFMDTSTPTDITTVAGTFVNLNDTTDQGFSVPAQQAYRWGYGVPNEGAGSNQGYIYVQLIDDTAGNATNEDGMLRLVVADANLLRQETIFEERTEELDGDRNDRNQRVALPEQGPLAKFNDLLIVQFKGDAADVIQPDFCTIAIPATLYQPVAA